MLKLLLGIASHFFFLINTPNLPLLFGEQGFLGLSLSGG